MFFNYFTFNNYDYGRAGGITMRLYNIHPKYLDQKGLCGLWAESLLAQSVLLKGEFSEHPQTPHTRLRRTPYWNHPALNRFKGDKAIYLIGNYLHGVAEEGIKRGYKFDINKIEIHIPYVHQLLTVTKGQLVFEISHLLKKLKQRDRKKYIEISKEIEWREGANYLYYNESKIQAHSLFKIIEGGKEQWERV